MPPPALTTSRLTLRLVGPQDQAAVATPLNDLAVSGWLAVVPYPYTPADFDLFQQEIAKPGVVFAVEDAAGFAGILGLEDDIPGYWFAPHTHAAHSDVSGRSFRQHPVSHSGVSGHLRIVAA